MTTSFPSVVEAYEQQRLAKAQREGFALFPIRGDESSYGFVYTVGMAQHDLPELLCFFEPELANGTCVFMEQIARRLIAGSKRFDRHALLASFIRTGITVSDPEIHYSPEFLKGDAFVYALQAYLTRAGRFRNELGMPKGVLCLNHEGVPTLQQQRAILMLAGS